jgi:hypothetical protein
MAAAVERATPTSEGSLISHRCCRWEIARRVDAGCPGFAGLDDELARPDLRDYQGGGPFRNGDGRGAGMSSASMIEEGGRRVDALRVPA